MIIDNPKRLAVFMPPKTATHSLYEIFRNANLSHVSHDHINLEGMLVQFPQMIPILSEFTFYAFYREPLDRALSMLTFLKRRRVAEVMHRLLGNDPPKISCLNRRNYENQSTAIQAANDAIPLIRVWRGMRNYIDGQKLGAYSKQVNWLNKPSINMIYLNFHDHDNEIRRLLTGFGANPNIVIPTENEQPKLPIDTVTPEEAAEIRAFYQEDYDFFASKGITFA
jgi:hypothetical protein